MTLENSLQNRETALRPEMRLSLLFIVNLIPFLAVDRRHHRVDCVRLGVVDKERLGPAVAVAVGGFRGVLDQTLYFQD